MFDVGIQLDVTPVSGPPYIHEYRGGTANPLGDPLKREVQATEMVSGKPLQIQRGNVATPLVSGLRHKPQMEAIQTEAADDALLISARESRITLLVRQYDGSTTKEEAARLEILTQRLRRLSPHVTVADVDELSNVIGRIEEISTRADELRGRFGIR